MHVLSPAAAQKRALTVLVYAQILSGADLAEPHRRASGISTVLVAIGGAGAGMASGLVVSAWSYGTLGVASAVLAVALLGVLALRPHANRR